jgi:hypothetical protein
MTAILSRIFLITALFVPGLLFAQPQQTTTRDNGQFVVFLHGGGTDTAKIEDQDLRQIGAVLVKKGYIVRAPDMDRDQVGGPGVDYFSDEARTAAEDVASTVNAELSNRKLLITGKELKPRRQNLKNPPGYLGVWLF